MDLRLKTKYVNRMRRIQSALGFTHGEIVSRCLRHWHNQGRPRDVIERIGEPTTRDGSQVVKCSAFRGLTAGLSHADMVKIVEWRLDQLDDLVPPLEPDFKEGIDYNVPESVITARYMAGRTQT